MSRANKYIYGNCPFDFHRALYKKILIRAINKMTGQNAFHRCSMIVLEDKTYFENAAAVDDVGN